MILVGDSLAMVILGYDATYKIGMEEMTIFTKAVARGVNRAMVVADMPFMSYQVSVEQAVENAGRLIKETGANAVKLEGGAAVCSQIRAIVDSGIPVCAHIGMTPQSVNVFGGFKVQGKGEANAEQVLKDAFAVQEAGAFMCVLECVPPKLAGLITGKTEMITIGIGSGVQCDGQVLVLQDMLGIGEFRPKFVKRFDEIGARMKEVFQTYDQEVKNGVFPDETYAYGKSDCSDEFLKELDGKY